MGGHLGFMARVVGVRRAFVQEGLPGLAAPERSREPAGGRRVPTAPDRAVTSPERRTVYVELAHRRHQAQIAARRLVASLDAC